MFCQDYTVEWAITEAELQAVFGFVAIRHYELIATIGACQGLSALHTAFFDQQYQWLMNWREFCRSKGQL